MKSLQLSFEAVAPIFILMLLGYVLKTLHLGSKAVFDGLNKLIFRVFLPVLLFYNIYKTEPAAVFDGRLILFCVIGILLVFVIGYFAVLKMTDENARRGVMLQGFFRSNVAFLGIVLVDYICAENTTGLASLTVAVAVPLVNVLAVVCLERFRHGKPNFWVLLKGIFTNPLVIGCALGLVFAAIDLTLPKVLEAAVSDVAKTATPLAMIVLGASFTFSSLRGYTKEICITVLAKLIFIPLLSVLTAVLLGFRGEALACILCTFATPVAVASFSMAQQMDGDEKLASHVVVISSAFCVVTLFLFIFALDYLHLF